MKRWLLRAVVALFTATCLMVAGRPTFAQDAAIQSLAPSANEAYNLNATNAKTTIVDATFYGLQSRCNVVLGGIFTATVTVSTSATRDMASPTTRATLTAPGVYHVVPSAGQYIAAAQAKVTSYTSGDPLVQWKCSDAPGVLSYRSSGSVVAGPSNNLVVTGGNTIDLVPNPVASTLSLTPGGRGVNALGIFGTATAEQAQFNSGNYAAGAPFALQLLLGVHNVASQGNYDISGWAGNTLHEIAYLPANAKANFANGISVGPGPTPSAPSFYVSSSGDLNEGGGALFTGVATFTNTSNVGSVSCAVAAATSCDVLVPTSSSNGCQLTMNGDTTDVAQSLWLPPSYVLATKTATLAVSASSTGTLAAWYFCP